MRTFGEGANQRISDLLEHETSNRSCIHKKPKKSSYNSKTLKNRTIFLRDFWNINVYFCICAVGARKFRKFFLINTAKKHSKRPFYGIWLKIVDLWPAWGGGTNPPNLPPAYAHGLNGRIITTTGTASEFIG